MSPVAIESNIQMSAMDSELSNSDVFSCIFAHNESAPVKTDFLLAVSVVPHKLSKNDAQLITIKSNKLPTLKCSKSELIRTKFTEQPYVCESFNHVSTSSDSFYILIQGKRLLCSKTNEFSTKLSDSFNIFR